MFDVNAAQGDAKRSVIKQLQHCKLARDKNGTYNHDKITKVKLTIKRVLKGIYNSKKDGEGMSNLLNTTPNNVNMIKTNNVVSWKTIIIKSAKEAKEATKKALKKSANANFILPMITKHEDMKEEAKCQNITNQTIAGTKEGVINSLIRIVRGGILDAVTMTPDGSDYLNINSYTLHELMQVAIQHASRPKVDKVCSIINLINKDRHQQKAL